MLFQAASGRVDARTREGEANRGLWYLLIPPSLDAISNNLTASTRLPSLPDLEASRFRASQLVPIQFGMKLPATQLAFTA